MNRNNIDELKRLFYMGRLECNFPYHNYDHTVLVQELTTKLCSILKIPCMMRYVEEQAALLHDFGYFIGMRKGLPFKEIRENHISLIVECLKADAPMLYKEICRVIQETEFPRKQKGLHLAPQADLIAQFRNPNYPKMLEALHEEWVMAELTSDPKEQWVDQKLRELPEFYAKEVAPYITKAMDLLRDTPYAQPLDFLGEV